MPDSSLWLQRLKEAGLLITTAVALYLLLALVSYSPSDPGWTAQHTGAVQNVAGVFGAWLADIALSFLGYFAYLLPFCLAYGMWVVYKERVSDPSTQYLFAVFRLVGAALVLTFGSALATWMFMDVRSSFLPQGPGGILGSTVFEYTYIALGHYGALLLFLTGILMGITLFSGMSWFSLIKRGMLATQRCLQNILAKGRAAASNIKLPERPARAEKKTLREPRSLRTAPTIDVAEPSPSAEPILTKPSPLKGAATRLTEATPKEQVMEAPAAKTVRSVKEKNTPLPTIALLDDPQKRRNIVSDEVIEEMSRLVETRLAEFNVQATVEGVCPGPVVTRFELQLAPGVKVSKLAGLAKDLARALSVLSVRIVEVIPGKTFVGLEIPNEKREIVRLKEVLDTTYFRDSESPTTLALGKDIAGKPSVVNLAKMPHLLVAGTTGSGKSVGVNAMLISMLLKAGPDQLRLIMIDPKMLELSIYEGIPHLLTPVVTDMKEAAASLRWAVKEMDRRYELMSKLGVRNIAGLNEKIDQANAQGEPMVDPTDETPGAAVALEKLPYIVVVVDEFADMMMVVGKKVEELIARIAQKARAAGIHLVLATQRPSVDVITGLIKANIPTRMAFQVSSKIDSRTVLDQQGAEQLLGHGDMLYLPPGSGVPIRVHGAFVADHEVHAVVNAWKSRGEPNYIESILQTEEEGEGGAMGEGSDGEHDPLYDEAVGIVVDSQRASISNVQRRLKIGYNRAARLIEQMEASGVVSSMQHNGMREVLVPNRE